MALRRALAAKLGPLTAMGMSSWRKPLLASTVEIIREILCSSGGVVRGLGAERNRARNRQLTIGEQLDFVAHQIGMKPQGLLRACVVVLEG